MNLMYGFVLMFLVVTCYQVINTGITALCGSAENAPLLGVEPLGFGIFTTGADSLCVGCKNLLRRIIADAKKA